MPGLLGKSELFTSDDIIQGDVLRTMLDLICSLKHKSQLAGLGVLAGLAMTSAETARRLLSPKLHQACALRTDQSTEGLAGCRSLESLVLSGSHVMFVLLLEQPSRSLGMCSVCGLLQPLALITHLL